MAKTTSLKKVALKKAILRESLSSLNATPEKTTTDYSSAPMPTTDAQSGLKELLVDSIKDIYWAENHLVKNLPKMQSAASATALQTAIADHLVQTKGHVSRLEQVFELLGEKKQAKKCDAMEGLTKEGEGIIEDTDAGTPARDTGIIMASQKVEHYEIATYGGLVQLAKNLGFADVAAIFEETLAEEQEADQLLTDIAVNDISYS